MFQVLLLFLVIVLGVSCVLLLIFLIDGRKLPGYRPIRAWRHAWSKRATINRALKRARESDNRARQAYDRMVWEQGEAEKVKAQAEASAQRAIAEASDRTDFVTQQAQNRVESMENSTRDMLARMGSFIIAEQCGEHIKSIKANNYHAKEKKILRSIEVASKNGYKLPGNEKTQLVRMLKQAHEKALRMEEEKQRQAEVREIRREEEKAQREIQRAIKKAEEDRKQKEREAEIKRKALEEAIALLGDTHSEQIDEMRLKLAEAQQEAEDARLAAERTKSMAEQTKQGHIYVISNIGSFGQDMYKVGMTRRLEPMDRVKELGDASVPFSFDVHAMFSADDAPALEAALHRRLNPYRVNRVNLRKEYFRVPLHEIISAVKDEHGEIDYEVDPEALEYFESLELANESDTVEDRIAAEIGEAAD